MSNWDKRVSISHGIPGSNPDLICLQETKIECINVDIVREVWGHLID